MHVKNHLSILGVILCMIGVITFALPSYAQGGGSNSTTVKIIDAVGPVIGASAMIDGTLTGGVSDLDGQVVLNGVKTGDVITVSMMGYTTVQVTYQGQATISVTLEEESIELSGTVVTALGIKREERALSYNVQQVNSDKLTAVKDANFVNSLSGKVAGVTINSGANGAGGASRVVMRGTKSITGSNAALYVIDGIPMTNLSNSASGAAMSDQPGTDGVADINPEDIESITLLTGPSAAALYGNSAASGVVMITTKKGEAGKTTVTFSNSTVFSTVYMLPEMQSKYGNEPNTVASWGTTPVNTGYSARDFFNTGSNVINTVTLSTGTKKNQTYASASTTNSNGILPNSDYNRYNFSFRNTSVFAHDRLTLDVGASLVFQDDRNMMSQGYYYNPLPGLYLFPRGENFEDVRMYERYNATLGYNENYWPYGNGSIGMQNPYWVQYRELRENKKRRYMANASLKYQITDWLDIVGRVKLDNYTNRLTYKLFATTDSLWAGEGGGYHDVTSSLNNLYADVIATANKSWESWSLNVNLGASLNDAKYETIGYVGNLSGELPNFFAVHNLDMTTKYKPNQNGYHDQAQAIFASAEVGFRRMIYLTLTGRNDWESQLAYSDYKSFFYPSVGLSLVISNMFNAPSWLSFLKVRASYTEVGNSYDRFMNLVQYPYDGESNSWTSTTTYPNLKLKPERTKSWEAGLNVWFLQRINLDATYYKSNTFNQTFSVTLPSSSGYSSMPIQSGNIENQGLEFKLAYDDSWGDFRFGATYTLTVNRNKVVRLTGDSVENPFTGEPIALSDRLEVGSFGGLDAKIYLQEGGSMGDVYANHLLTRDFNGYIYDDPSAGITMSSTDDFFLGSIFPKANMGLNIEFGWKGISLSAT
ncbi:MAG: SusC/RagA family TonB-linked outer membrane protein, partial [Bacteroidales bacterium]|nr:SusC/RagA family TonB-linked outer membrane protein [Bacteroidales bacterium]